MSARPPFRGGAILLRAEATPAEDAQRLLDGLARSIGHQPTGDDLRALGERVRAVASELMALAGEADRARARGEGR